MLTHYSHISISLLEETARRPSTVAQNARTKQSALHKWTPSHPPPPLPRWQPTSIALAYTCRLDMKGTSLIRTANKNLTLIPSNFASKNVDLTRDKQRALICADVCLYGAFGRGPMREECCRFLEGLSLSAVVSRPHRLTPPLVCIYI